MQTAPAARFQADVFARLKSIPLFNPFACIMEGEGATDADVKKALGVVQAGGIKGKQKGTLILVGITEDGPEGDSPNVRGPRESHDLTVRVAQAGLQTKLSPSAVGFELIAHRLKQAFHQWKIGTAPVLYLGATPYSDGKGIVGKDVLLRWTPAPEVWQDCRQPTVEVANIGAVAFACNTPNARIFATFDGSYPDAIPANATPTGYYVQPGDLIRAVAYPGEGENLLPSGVTEVQK